MLLPRSIFLQVCLFLTLTRCNCQDYEHYGAEESDDDSSDIQDESGPVDYSKYYAVDTSAPLVSAQGNPNDVGFSSPIENAAFFAPSIDFGASVKQEVAQPNDLFAQPKNLFAAQTQTSGFVSSKEQFPSFLQSGQFPIDYFEEAQKVQRAENQEVDAGSDGVEGFQGVAPDYISHGIPLNLEADYSAGVESFEKPQKPKKTTNYDVEKEASAEYEYQPSVPSGKYTDYNTGKSSSTVAQPQATGFYEKLTGASIDPTATPYEKYSFQPVTEDGFKAKFTGGLVSTVAPFNPAYNKIASTAAPATFEAQPSENVPAHLKGKNCKRIRKHIPEDDEHRRRKREAMNCFVCENLENSSKYTQCSYAVEPEPQNDYSGTSERYSTPAKQPEGYRYKRYSGDEYVDPYEYIKNRSLKEYETPKENKDEYQYDYKIPEFYTADDGVDKSFSEIQTEAIAKNPANCHKEESEGMTCTICKDPKSGGNFEQCSYTSAPKQQKYAYVTEKKYDSDEPEQGSETKPAVQTKKLESTIKDSQDEKKVEPVNEFKSSEKIPDYKPSEEFKALTASTNDKAKFDKLDSKFANFKPAELYNKQIVLPSNDNSKYTKLENFKPSEDYKANYQGHDKFKLSAEYNPDSKEDPNSKKEPLGYQSGIQSGQSTPNKLVSDDPYDIPKHFAESTIREQKTGIRGLEPSLYGSADSSEVEGGDADSRSESEPYKEIDEYHFKLFPEFSHEESQQATVVANNPSADTTRKDVEEVLAEFTKKDRSACKKAQKNGMTCYLCVDQKGIQHEECMFVSESKPQASHLAYHEVKQIKAPAQENKQTEQVPSATETKPLKKVDTMEAAASEGYESKVRYNPKKGRTKNVKKTKEPELAASNDDPEKLSDDDPEKLTDEDVPVKAQTPVEFEVGAEEGAFSAETKPVYSKTLGVKLPRYMIEKSEFEKEFDEFAGLHE